MQCFRKRETNINSDYKPVLGKRPLFFAAVSLLLGILFAAEFGVDYILTFGISAIFFVLHIFFSREKYCGIALLLAVFFLGAGFFSVRINNIDNEAFKCSGYTEITGRVREINKKADGSTVYKLSEVKGIRSFDYCVFANCDDDSFVLDDIIVCTGEASMPSRKGYIFGFDDRLYCAANGVSLRFYADTCEQIGHSEDLLAWIDSLRYSIGDRMDELFRNAAPIAKAMFIGIDEDIDSVTGESYRSAGISHVLCISGLHLGVICYSVLMLLRKMRRLHLEQIVPCAVLLLVYTALAGFKLSILRSAIMFFIMLCANASFKRYDSLTALAAAFTVLVLFNPAVVFDSGFQLSFGSVFSILCIYSSMPEKIKQSPVYSAVAVSLAAFIGNVLLLANMNNEINLVSLIVNPIVVTVAGLAVPAVAVATVLYCIFGGVTIILGYFGVYLIAVMNNIATLADTANINIAVPALFGITILVWYLEIFVMSKYVLIRKRLKLICCLALIAIIPVSVFCSGYGKEELRIVFLSDTYSNCAIINTPTGNTYLIDAGGSSASEYVRDFALDVDAVFITGVRSKSTGSLEDFSHCTIYAPKGEEESLADYDDVVFIHERKAFTIEEGLIIKATPDKNDKKICYDVYFDNSKVLTYLASIPDESSSTEAKIVFVDSLSDKSRQYINSCGSDYVIIKEESTDYGLNVPVINLIYSGSVNVTVGKDTEVSSLYDGS